MNDQTKDEAQHVRPHEAEKLMGMEVNIAFIDNDSTHDTLCIMVDVRYGRLTVPILETPVRAGHFHQVFLIRHHSTQRLDSISRFWVEKPAWKRRKNMSFFLAKPYGPGLKSRLR